jgi:hypothetical protein
MGVDLKVLASYFRQCCGRFLITATLRLDRCLFTGISPGPRVRKKWGVQRGCPATGASSEGWRG